MALVVRSHSDLVYLPDHGLVGEEGALRILIQITRQIHRLDISHNLLGPFGTGTLVDGLASLRRVYSDPNGLEGYVMPHGGIWGLREMNLGANALDDESFDLVLRYAKKDVWLEKVLMQGNAITRRDMDLSLREQLQYYVPIILYSLNSSRLTTLSLTNNPLSSAGFVEFMSLLHSPHLVSLHLSTCGLNTIQAAKAIASFLRSPRSRSLEYLELNGNFLGLEGVRLIVDAVEESNFGIRHLGLLANHEPPPASPPSDGDGESSGNGQNGEMEEGERERAAERHLKYMREMEYQVHQRLAGALQRNVFCTHRIRIAAAKAIAPARILLHALPPDPVSVARDVIENVSIVSENSTNGHRDGARNGTRTPPFHGAWNGPFRLLDLPEEIIHLVVRHASGDASAFSEAQFVRLRKEASSRTELGKAVNATRAKMRGKDTPEERRAALMELRNEWLRKGKWDKWETNPRGASLEVLEPTRSVAEEGGDGDGDGDGDGGGGAEMHK